MESREQIGQGFPIVCPRHPEQAQIVTSPKLLSTVAPEGGCLLPCKVRLLCGHICQSVCHPDFDGHRGMICDEPCTRTPCIRRHPCPLRCSEDCGKCQFPIYNVVLPCGHTAKRVPCHSLEDLTLVQCEQKVVKKLPSCGHSLSVPCHQDPQKSVCQELCGGTMLCYSRSCRSKCSDCQQVTKPSLPDNFVGIIAQTSHVEHLCERLLYCQHNCGLACSQNHDCNSMCAGQCRQTCSHHACTLPCWQPCPPCMEPCDWTYAHMSCSVSCGSICSRLPCDQPCTH